MFLWIASAFAAYFVKGVCGFANTLVLTSILSFRAVNADISPIDLLLGYPSNLILAWRNRRSLDPKVWIPLSLLVLAGSIPGALLLIPFALLGLFLGIKSSGVLSEKLVRRLTAVLLIVSGISLVIKNLP